MFYPLRYMNLSKHACTDNKRDHRSKANNQAPNNCTDIKAPNIGCIYLHVRALNVGKRYIYSTAPKFAEIIGQTPV